MSLRTQGTTLFSAILVLVATTVVLQLWLLTFSMEGSGSERITRRSFRRQLPRPLFFALNAGLLRYVFRFDRQIRSSK